MRKMMAVVGAYKEFRSRLIDSEQYRLIGYEYVLPGAAKDVMPRAEVHFYIGNSGRLMAVQCWEDGSFQHYFPGKSQKIVDCVKEAIEYDKSFLTTQPK
jgi:hypothetical protein